MVHDGVGTKADPVKAWALATLAGERGEKEAEKLATEINGKLTEAQRAEAAKELENIKSGKSAKKDEPKPAKDAKDAKDVKAPTPAPAPKDAKGSKGK